ncbi:MAG TPA: homocysteine S-methyltransferase family protein [Syntrophomonadaceae bacterium]|nr:homocysteine S-methyltransferase family protein [Syntrophomonadaceae bacterium]
MIKDIEGILRERILVLDGAMGTMLQQKGMMPGQCPELFGIEHPEVLQEIHQQYAEAGAEIIETNTFGANRFKLAEYGLEDRVEEINAEAVRLARAAAKNKALVAGCIGPTGRLLRPMGNVNFDDLYDAFAQQAAALERAGADLISIETMTDIGEMRAALIAAKQASRLPVIAHLTFESGGRTMTGTDPLTTVVILDALQPLAIGANCSGGALDLLPIIEVMGRHSRSFISVEPNAGLPRLVGDKTVFPALPEEMAEHALRLKDAGANLIGGCCGTTPQHIQSIAAVLKGMPAVRRQAAQLRGFASRSQVLLIGADQPLAVIGERINPTARKKLASDIKEGKMQLVVEEAKRQAGVASMLDVNMGVPGIDEPAAMNQAVAAIQAAVDIPLSLDSTNQRAIEEGLKSFVGRALINSTTGEDKSLDAVLPLAKKYGAAVLGLCLDENGIPDSAEGRMQVARKIYRRARECGLRDEDIFIDCLVKTASAEQVQVMETLSAVQQVKQEMGVGTVLGISNVSHGLPARDILNSTFLAMAWAAGLDLPILNPFDQRMMDVTRAAAVLLNRDEHCASFINYYKNYSSNSLSTGGMRHPICERCNIPDQIKDREAGTTTKNTANLPAAETATDDITVRIQKAVMEGNSVIMEALIEEALQKGMPALDIVNQGLIPGIERAGELYEQKKYFLPQLMTAAEAMKKAFAFIKPFLSQEAATQHNGTIVMATVEGDIHDIGKNIVIVMLENYGFKVVDLGKDVPADKILEAARQEDADIIGLSALMTTTMPRMRDVIEGVKNLNLRSRVMVGGAVLNQEYADQIGADAYSADARAAVKTAQQLMRLFIRRVK